MTLIKINIKTVLETAISAPKVMILLSTKVIRATTTRITKIRMNSRLRLFFSFSESEDLLLNTALFMISVMGSKPTGYLSINEINGIPISFKVP